MKLTVNESDMIGAVRGNMQSFVLKTRGFEMKKFQIYLWTRCRHHPNHGYTTLLETVSAKNVPHAKQLIWDKYLNYFRFTKDYPIGRICVGSPTYTPPLICIGCSTRTNNDSR